MNAVRHDEVYEMTQVLYVALELSMNTWKLALGDGSQQRVVSVRGGDVAAVLASVAQARQRWGLAERVPVRSGFEAGRDGFWLHRALTAAGLDNVVLDSSSIEVNRRRRRAKTDRIDALKLLALLIRRDRGERRAVSVVRVPTPEQEDARRLHREREHVQRDRTRVRNRVRGLLATQGVRLQRWTEAAPERLHTRHSADGRALPPDLLQELARLWQLWQLLEQQCKQIEATQRQRLQAGRAAGHGPYALMAQLLQLKAVGPVGAGVLVHEVLGWRRFNNRRELAASVGLVPMPYNSGASSREQGISKAGSRRVRALMIELAWDWLRWQPDSDLSRWYRARFAGSARSRKVGIVALARKLLVALWRLSVSGEWPAGAVAKAAA